MQAPIDQKIQFPWQRPVIDPTTSAATPAPGVWVRVAEALADPNWGSLFTPRVGDEVLINFIDNDIDHPVIVGGLYNGEDLPPYSAGVDSSANHPGTRPACAWPHTSSLPIKRPVVICKIRSLHGNMPK